MKKKTTTRVLAAIGFFSLIAVVIPAQAADTYGPIRPGDSLWKIAGEVYRDQAVTRDQGMLAILKANPETLGSSCNVNAPLHIGASLRVPPAAEARLLTAAEARREVGQQTRDWKEHLRTGRSLVCAPPKPAAAATTRAATPAPPAARRAGQSEVASPPTASVGAASASRGEPEHAAARTAVVPPAPEPSPKPKVPAPQGSSATEVPQAPARPPAPAAGRTPGVRLASVFGKREFLVWLGISMVLALLGVGLARRYSATSAEADRGPGRDVRDPAALSPSSGAAAVGQPAMRWRTSFSAYLRKMRGTTRGSPPRVSVSEMVWSWLGAFFGIGAVGLLNQLYFTGTDLTLVIGSFGASAVLVYGAIRSPLAQPRNLVGGHVLSAVVGVVTWKLLQHDPWLADAVAVATAIALMHATKTLHPPGGATALIAVIGSKKIHDLGFLYCLMPATVGPLILLAVALLVNNIPASRRYPETWV